MPRIAIVGAGLIGRSWANVFARGGWDVGLYDPIVGQARNALPLIVAGLRDLAEKGLIKDADAAAARVTVANTLEEALSGAIFVQENAPEKVEDKLALFADLDRLAAPDAILASSTSAIVASRFTEALAGRSRTCPMLAITV